MSTENDRADQIDEDLVQQLVEAYFDGDPQAVNLIDPNSSRYYMENPTRAEAWRIVQEQMGEGRKIEVDVSKW